MKRTTSYIFVLLLSSACSNKNPERTSILIKDRSKIQKTIKYKNNNIFLQKRTNKHETNDLIIESEDNKLRYLSNNKFLIQDFCITKEGVLYYAEAGEDIGYEPIVGIRLTGFSIKHIDLNDVNLKIHDFFPGEGSSLDIYRPLKLELDYEEKYICFCTNYGIYIIDCLSQKEINILPSTIDRQDICGQALTPDRKSLVVLINTGTDKNGKYIWIKHKINLRTKKLSKLNE